MPFFVLGGVLVLETAGYRKPFFIGFAVLTLLLAQFWLKMNVVPWLGTAAEGINELPKQLYFMHYGLWMSWAPYIVQLLLAGLIIVWMKKTLPPQKL